MEIFWLTVWIILSVAACPGCRANIDRQGCRLRVGQTAHGARNHYLVGHVYARKAAATRVKCAVSCLTDAQCASFNLCPNQENPCELNNSTREQHGVDLLEKDGCIYFDFIKETEVLSGSSDVDVSTVDSPSTAPPTPTPSTVVSSPSYCADKTISGTYTLSAPGTAYDGKDVYCDADADGGGWLVFQRRVDGSTDFYQTQQAYADGFGDVSGNFWLGNSIIHILTKTGHWQLRVDLTDWDGVKAYAQYDDFSIGSYPGFRLAVSGYNGTAGDSLVYHNNMDFTTKDYDRDGASGGNCAQWLSGAWWYNFCHHSALNGNYLTGGGVTERDQGIQWVAWKGHEYSMKESQMKIRPKI